MQLPNNWDKTIQARDGHVLQSSQWAKFQGSIGRQPYYEITDDWYWMAFNRQVSGLRYLLAVENPIVDHKPLDALESIAIKGRDLHCDFVRVEPKGNVTKSEMEEFGAIKVADVEPSTTLVLDLSKSIDELRSALSKSHRNRINTGPKRGISVKKSTELDNIEGFLRLMHDTASHSKIKNHPDWYFEKMAQSLISQGIASYYIATVEDTPASISLIYDWGDTRYYAYTGNDQVLNRQYDVGVSNLWKMILDAKEDGKKYFDFWGIAPEGEENHPWAGLTAYKKSFGGEVVSSLGTYDIVINKAKYRLYNTYKKLRGRK
ncbi:MAG TPA: peptidoglycan bridge formation glycyltransferase FemA/FemB family protein [Candidatus Saccharibacteria bacterium]|nr:peptidoglycan bridge formation glycyltransferase FemA/FemB family protein [Candidatus Saccharibacteria bacterium]HMT39718.1 peptidoglycan bridge formation glycyltransferase FemA/FemB family protein [Candidatus Saccharibacteria bacterium]